jgi:DNA-binding LacI/PurR family transcriptional regulator
MQDIATASGVSQSTVSRVLTGASTVVPINPATRQRVLEIARQMRYRPNPLARGLRGSRTMLLGVIVREITDPFFPVAIDAVSAEAAKRGYNVVLGHAHGRADEAIALRAVLETRHCDAILLLGDIGDHPGLLEDLRDTNVTVVAAWQGSSVLPGIATVNVDNRLGMNGLVDHLVGLGHRIFGFIGGGFIEGRPLGDIRERRVAFLERLAARNIASAGRRLGHWLRRPALRRVHDPAAHYGSDAHRRDGGRGRRRRDRREPRRSRIHRRAAHAVARGEAILGAGAGATRLRRGCVFRTGQGPPKACRPPRGEHTIAHRIPASQP